MQRITIGTLVVGVVLTAFPMVVARWLRIEDHADGVRRAGIADLALVPALAKGRPRWVWAVVRTGQTLAFAGVAARWARRDRTRATRLLVVGLLVLASQDGVVAGQLLRSRSSWRVPPVDGDGSVRQSRLRPR